MAEGETRECSRCDGSMVATTAWSRRAGDPPRPVWRCFQCGLLVPRPYPAGVPTPQLPVSGSDVRPATP